MNAEAQKNEAAARLQRQKLDTLNGGRLVKIQLVPEKKESEEPTELLTEDVKVRQVKISEYFSLFPHAFNEAEIVSKICDKPIAWIDRVSPESYEALQAAVWEVNERGFFSFAGRQRKRNQEALDAVSPEMVTALADRLVEKIQGEVKKPTSPTSSLS